MQLALCRVRADCTSVALASRVACVTVVCLDRAQPNCMLTSKNHRETIGENFPKGPLLGTVEGRAQYFSLMLPLAMRIAG